MKKFVVALFWVCVALSSCRNEIEPRTYTQMIVVRFENPKYNDYVVGRAQKVSQKDYAVLEQCFFDNTDSAYINLANGYKMVSHCFYPYANGWITSYYGRAFKFVIMDKTISEYAECLDPTGGVPDMQILDTFPKFEYYVFTYDRMGQYQSDMPYQTVPYYWSEIYKDFYSFCPKAGVSADIHRQYINIMQDIILNRPDDLKRFCTLYIKDNEILIQRETE